MNRIKIVKEDKNIYFNIIRELLKDKTLDPFDNGKELLYWIYKYELAEIFALLYGYITNDTGRYKLSVFVDKFLKTLNDEYRDYEHKLEIMKSLLSEGYDPSDDNNIAILYAVINGYMPMIELLLNDSRVDISVDDYVIFTLTTNEDIIRVLLQKSYSNEYTESIIISIRQENYKIMKLLLKKDHKSVLKILQKYMIREKKYVYEYKYSTRIYNLLKKI